MDNEYKNKLRKLLIYLVLFILVVIGLHLLYDYLFLGRLKVVTNSPDSNIKVSKGINLNDLNSGQPISQSVGSLNTSLSPGTYTVFIKTTSNSYEKLVNIQSRKTTVVDVNLKKSLSSEPVSSRQIDGLYANSNELTYFDSNNGNLYQVDSSNTEHLLSANYDLTSIKWADANFGVAQDSNNQLYLIQNNSISPLVLPFTQGKSEITYAVAPNRTVYIAVDYSVYRGTVGGSFTKIFDLQNQTAYLTASNNSVAVFDFYGTAYNQKIRSSNSYIAVINTSSQTHKARGGLVDKGSWAPDGTKLVTSNGSETDVWSSSLKKEMELPVANVSSLNWLDSNTVIYSVGQQLWEYNLASGSSYLLTATQNSSNITNVFPGSSGDYIYFQTEELSGSAPVYYLNRVGLKNQAVSVEAEKLLAIVPNTVGSCTFNLLNFTKLSIEINGPLSDQQVCTQSASNYLSQYNINPSGLDLSFTTSS